MSDFNSSGNSNILLYSGNDPVGTPASSAGGGGGGSFSDTEIKIYQDANKDMVFAKYVDGVVSYFSDPQLSTTMVPALPLSLPPQSDAPGTYTQDSFWLDALEPYRRRDTYLASSPPVLLSTSYINLNTLAVSSSLSGSETRMIEDIYESILNEQHSSNFNTLNFDITNGESSVLIQVVPDNIYGNCRVFYKMTSGAISSSNSGVLSSNDTMRITDPVESSNVQFLLDPSSDPCSLHVIKYRKAFK